MIVIYKCEFCNKKFDAKSTTKKHEDKCLYNPENKTCYSCGRSFTKDADNYSGRDIHCTHYGRIPSAWSGDFELGPEVKTDCEKWIDK